MSERQKKAAAWLEGQRLRHQAAAEARKPEIACAATEALLAWKAA